MFSRDFEFFAAKEPEEVVKLVLDNKETVLSPYIDSSISGVSSSDKINEINFELLEEFLLTFVDDSDLNRLRSMCSIIENRNETCWNCKIINLLEKTATGMFETQSYDVLFIETNNDANSLQLNGLNCPAGYASRAIGHLLWNNNKLFDEFKETIVLMANDKKEEVRYASLYSIVPTLDIDKEWASLLLLSMFEKDIRLAIFPDSPKLFFFLYHQYRHRVIDIIKKCFHSEDDSLIEVGGFASCAFYILYDEFREVFQDINSQSYKQMKAIIKMAIQYLELPKHREKAKKIILMYKKINNGSRNLFPGLFSNNCLDAKRDFDFICEIISSKIGKHLLGYFIEFVKNNSIALIDYAEPILDSCEDVLKMDSKSRRAINGIERYVSKLVVSLYDEAATINDNIANKCLDLLDEIFEDQLSCSREISERLMNM